MAPPRHTTKPRRVKRGIGTKHTTSSPFSPGHSHSFYRKRTSAHRHRHYHQRVPSPPPSLSIDPPYPPYAIHLTRPDLSNLRTPSSSHTPYITMLLDQESIPRRYMILAAISSWLLLLGYILLPGTFTGLKCIPQLSTLSLQDHGDHSVVDSSKSGTSDDIELNVTTTTPIIRPSPQKDPTPDRGTLLSPIKHIPLAILGTLLITIGFITTLALGLRLKHNYVWLRARLLIPGAINALAGMLSTFTVVYAQQAGVWSTPAIAAVAVEGTAIALCLGLLAWYTVKIQKVRTEHGFEMRKWDYSIEQQQQRHQQYMGRRKGREVRMEAMRRDRRDGDHGRDDGDDYDGVTPLGSILSVHRIP